MIIAKRKCTKKRLRRRTYREVIKTTELEVDGNRIWKILLKGTTICIVDDQGRERHRSKGHEITAVYLAQPKSNRMHDNGPN